MSVDGSRPTDAESFPLARRGKIQSLIACSDRTLTGPESRQVGLPDIVCKFSHYNFGCTCTCTYNLALDWSGPGPVPDPVEVLSD